jgi:hypothetical protein
LFHCFKRGWMRLSLWWSNGILKWHKRRSGMNHTWLYLQDISGSKEFGIDD